MCALAYYAGAYIRAYVPDISPSAITSIRFACLPLMLVVGIIMAAQLKAARDGFVEKQRTVDEMASVAIQMDRLLTYYGTPAAKAQAGFREYLHHIITNRDELWGMKDRSSIEQFAVDLQTLPVPAKDTGIASNTKRFIIDLMSKLSLDRYKLATLSEHETYGFTTALLASWLAVIFISIGLTSEPLSAAAFWVSLAIAACVGSMSFVTTEFDNARAGLVQVSTEPFNRVLKEIGG